MPKIFVNRKIFAASPYDRPPGGPVMTTNTSCHGTYHTYPPPPPGISLLFPSWGGRQHTTAHSGEGGHRSWIIRECWITVNAVGENDDGENASLESTGTLKQYFGKLFPWICGEFEDSADSRSALSTWMLIHNWICQGNCWFILEVELFREWLNKIKIRADRVQVDQKKQFEEKKKSWLKNLAKLSPNRNDMCISKIGLNI